MKFLTTIFALFTIITASAQQQTFDIISYTPPKGWKASAQQNVMGYSIVDKAKGTWAQIGIYKSTTSKGDIESDFNSEWSQLAAKQYNATGLETNAALAAGDWKVKAGGGKFRFNNADAIVLLTTMTGYNVCVSILATTNSQDYVSTIQSFIETIDLKKPSGNIVNNPVTLPANNPATGGAYAFTTTNFNDGWKSTVYDDYVLVTKENIKVYLSYLEKFNASEFTGNGKELRFHFWDNYAGKYFSTGAMRYNTGAPSNPMYNAYREYIEAPATDRQTGEKRFIAMWVRVVPFTGTLSIIIGSAPDEQQFRKQFPKAWDEYNSDLQQMYGYNKFAVGKNDLAGTWSSSGGGTMNWYSTTTGQNVGATGAVASDVFNFNTGNTYSSTHKGATGWVGSMNTYQQEYKGSYTVTDWSLTMTKRFEGKTENFDAWFEVLRGGRVLHLQNKQYSGNTYNLFKEK